MPPDVIVEAHTVTETEEIKQGYKLGVEPQKGLRKK
jgi:ATP:corrinoid adenosyltransferase